MRAPRHTPRCGACSERLQELRELAGARERELDLLEFELAEIDSAAPSEQEHDELLARRERVRRADALCSAAGLAAEALGGDGGDGGDGAGLGGRLAQAGVGLDALQGIDPRARRVLPSACARSAIESDDLAVELRAYAEGSQRANPRRAS